MKEFLKHKVFKCNLFGANILKLSKLYALRKLLHEIYNITCSFELRVLEFG